MRIAIILIATFLSSANASFNVESHRAQAMAIIRRAMAKNPNQTYASVLSGLSSVQMIVLSPQEAASTRCAETKPGTRNVHPGSFTRMNTGVIYICPGIGGGNSGDIAELLVHEAAHKAGIADECQAARIEVSILHDAGRSAYNTHSECGSFKGASIASETGR